MMTTPASANSPVSSVVALIPLRMGGKSRLGDALSDGRRSELVLAMLDDVLTAVREAGIEDVRVLAGDRTAADAAVARGVSALVDPSGTNAERPRANGDGPLRAAIDAALSVVGDRYPRLVVTADLPRLRADEVRRVCAHPADVVVAPTSGGGTALLRLSAGVTLPARYGSGSAHAHVAEADHRRWTSALLDLPGAHHDVDAATDLEALVGGLDGTAPGSATATFLAGLRG